MPFPASLVVKNGSKMWGIVSGIHADTGVAHGQLDLAVDAASRRAPPCRPTGIASRALSARFVITCSIWPPSARTRQPGVNGGRELDVVAQEPREQSLELLDDFAEIEDLRQEHLVAAEGEQLARERGSTIGGAHDLQRVRAARVVVVEAGHEELAVAADRGQEVVEVVRDAAGEPSDRLELLRVQQLLLQQALIGDVPVVDDDDPLAVLSAPAPDRLDRAPGAVAVAKPEPRSAQVPRPRASQRTSASRPRGRQGAAAQSSSCRGSPRAGSRARARQKGSRRGSCRRRRAS